MERSAPGTPTATIHIHPRVRSELTAGSPMREGLQRLELYAGKLARTVLRGGAASNGRFLPDSQPYPCINRRALKRGGQTTKSPACANMRGFLRLWHEGVLLEYSVSIIGTALPATHTLNRGRVAVGRFSAERSGPEQPVPASSSAVAVCSHNWRFGSRRLPVQPADRWPVLATRCWRSALRHAGAGPGAG